MIKVHRLNGEELFVNCDQIRSVEARPDTLITFIDGKTLLVQETPDLIRTRVARFKQECGKVGLEHGV